MTEKFNLNSLWYEQERKELLREFEAAHGRTHWHIRPHDLPRPKLSDVLRCARLAKAEPQIWEAAQEKALFTDEQRENREGVLLNLMGPFIDWFLLKNKLYIDYDDTAFVSIIATFREWAHPDFDGDDITALRRILKPFPEANYLVDDLAEDQSLQGEAS